MVYFLFFKTLSTTIDNFVNFILVHLNRRGYNSFLYSIHFALTLMVRFNCHG